MSESLWNKPHTDDSEHPAKTLAGAAGVALFGFGCLVTARWLFRLATIVVASHGGWEKAMRAGRAGSPDYTVLFWIALAAGAALAGVACVWIGARWLWVGAEAWARGERVEDDDPAPRPPASEK